MDAGCCQASHHQHEIRLHPERKFMRITEEEIPALFDPKI
jgi:hypothetical protein